MIKGLSDRYATSIDSKSPCTQLLGTWILGTSNCGAGFGEGKDYCGTLAIPSRVLQVFLVRAWPLKQQTANLMIVETRLAAAFIAAASCLKTM